jgi:hypothetical protein
VAERQAQWAAIEMKQPGKPNLKRLSDDFDRRNLETAKAIMEHPEAHGGADIVALAHELPASVASTRPSGCQVCGGQPFITIDHSGQGTADRCRCPRGRHLMAREIEERQRQAA